MTVATPTALKPITAAAIINPIRRLMISLQICLCQAAQQRVHLALAQIQLRRALLSVHHRPVNTDEFV